MHEHCASFCIGCTACLGCAEAQDAPVNEAIALSFEEMWLKFRSGKEVLAVLGETEVRARLEVLQPGFAAKHNSWDAESCADHVLPLAVEAYKKAAETASKHAEELRFQREHQEEYYQQQMEREREEGRLYHARMLERERKERALWAEMEKELLEPSFIPDWQSLREHRRAKQSCRSFARRAQLEHKQKRLQKQQHGSNSGQKECSDRSRCKFKGAHSKECLEFLPDQHQLDLLSFVV